MKSKTKTILCFMIMFIFILITPLKISAIDSEIKDVPELKSLTAAENTNQNNLLVSLRAKVNFDSMIINYNKFRVAYSVDNEHWQEFTLINDDIIKDEDDNIKIDINKNEISKYDLISVRISFYYINTEGQEQYTTEWSNYILFDSSKFTIEMQEREYEREPDELFFKTDVTLHIWIIIISTAIVCILWFFSFQGYRDVEPVGRQKISKNNNNRKDEEDYIIDYDSSKYR